MNKLILYVVSLGIIFLPLKGLQAEIQTVSVTWNPVSCNSGCINLLNDQFRKQPGVADIGLSQGDGQANIKWKPNVGFSFQAVQYPMAMVGLYIKTLLVKARGTITHDQYNVYLNSIGDGTQFVLMSPAMPSQTNYVQVYSPTSHVLEPAMKDQLLEAEQSQKVVTINGPLFMPYRVTPLQLIIEHINFAGQQGSEEAQSP